MAGVDEVGRGALFGPVVAAAVLVPIEAIDQLQALGVKDSKKLSPQRRAQLAQALPPYLHSYGISFADVPTIERINIRQASLLAMERAVQKLPVMPAYVLVDGRDRLPRIVSAQMAITGGDGKSLLIGAASILAKVWRDSLITRLAERFPHYDLASNKGYGTANHRQGLRQYGATPLHRPLFCRKIIEDLD
ncbi:MULTISPECIES: ribonuclease HII [Synechocystis]|uniref:Ribonuclease HII n=1 Tax=Synechocystis salina LEGE 00031 TaxID=1828736 RepID=A0ABR9VNG2_9SYNC|nr:ribonuclease HII [Synechocystis sp. FACHB-383]MBE9240453.1 ribonuclease HII [Synechocystis salina LEGE 00041]MBE9252875.1 ribonuclease HII [Synechocystis salina LEGE 00031]